jgi:hypothetical protein
MKYIILIRVQLLWLLLFAASTVAAQGLYSSENDENSLFSDVTPKKGISLFDSDDEDDDDYIAPDPGAGGGAGDAGGDAVPVGDNLITVSVLASGYALIKQKKKNNKRT